MEDGYYILGNAPSFNDDEIREEGREEARAELRDEAVSVLNFISDPSYAKKMWPELVRLADEKDG